jgi:hypothetical protein
MEFKANGVSSVQLFNTETGKNIDFGEPISVSNDLESQPDKEYIFSNTVNSSIEFSCDNTTFDSDVFYKLLKPKSDNTTYVTMDVPIYKQARINKKRRINKKWLKRYGYKIVMKSVRGKVLGILSDEIPIKDGAELTVEFSQDDLKTLCQSSAETKQ